MLNKKGMKFLGEHIINLVITVIILVFLIYLVVKVYGIFTQGNELEKAVIQLEKIVEVVNKVKETEEESKVEIFPPKIGWSLMTFPFDFPEAECRGKVSCLCICEDLECSNPKARKCEGFSFEIRVDEVYRKYVGSLPYAIPTESNYEVFNEILILKKPAHELKIFKEGDIIKIKGLE
ncbi:MAG: hypothetical protein AABW90_03190 [Nanoarchaeota archaeon]